MLTHLGVSARASSARARDTRTLQHLHKTTSGGTNQSCAVLSSYGNHTANIPERGMVNVARWRPTCTRDHVHQPTRKNSRFLPRILRFTAPFDELGCQNPTRMSHFRCKLHSASCLRNCSVVIQIRGDSATFFGWMLPYLCS